MSEKLLSVSVAAYRVESFIRECLDSFIDENVSRRVEVIIVDDGSDDNTADIAAEYVNRFPDTFILISKENGGWGSTLNAAMKVARGKYFKQLDGDDSFDKGGLCGFLDFLEVTDADMVFSSYATFDDASGDVISERHVPDVLLTNRMDISVVMNRIPFVMHMMCVKTSILKKNKVVITENCFYTDIEFFIKSVNCSETMAGIDEIVYRYRVNRMEQSMSLAGLEKHYEDHVKAILTNLDYAVNEGNERCIDGIEKRIDLMIRDQYRYFLQMKPDKRKKKTLVEFDKKLKNNYPKYYKRKNKYAGLLRLAGFSFYGVLTRMYRTYRRLRGWGV